MNIKQLRAWLDAEEARHTPEMEAVYGAFEDTNVYVWAGPQGYSLAGISQDYSLGVIIEPTVGCKQVSTVVPVNPSWSWHRERESAL